jgi:hypothetical protein
MSHRRDLLDVASVLPIDVAYEIDFVPPSNERPAHYLATVADSNRAVTGYGATRGDALEEAVDRYLTAHWGGVAAEHIKRRAESRRRRIWPSVIGGPDL